MWKGEYSSQQRRLFILVGCMYRPKVQLSPFQHASYSVKKVINQTQLIQTFFSTRQWPRASGKLQSLLSMKYYKVVPLSSLKPLIVGYQEDHIKRSNISRNIRSKKAIQHAIWDKPEKKEINSKLLTYQIHDGP